MTEEKKILEKFQISSEISGKIKELKQYSPDCKCDNCGYEALRLFPKGQTSDGYFECPNCGCIKLRVRWKHTVDLKVN